MTRESPETRSDDPAFAAFPSAVWDRRKMLLAFATVSFAAVVVHGENVPGSGGGLKPMTQGLPGQVRPPTGQLIASNMETSAAARESGPGAGKEAARGAAAMRREGTKLQDLTGELREAGRRWVFIVGGESFPVLENLALQRAVQSIKDDGNDRFWTADAQVTEFMGENYLMLLRMTRTPRLK